MHWYVRIDEVPPVSKHLLCSQRELMLQPSDMPEMLIPLTSNRLIVFRHELMNHSYRPAGESVVLQTWLMSEPFAPDALGERIVSVRGDSGRAPAHHLADDPSARKQFRPARPPQCVRWWCGTRSQGSQWNVSTSICTTWRISTKLWAWVSRTPATVRSVRKMKSTTLTMSSSGLGKTLSPAFGPSFGPSFVRVRSLRSSCVSCFYFWLRTGLRSGMAVFWAFAVVWPFHFVVVLYCLCGLARPLYCCSLLRCLLLLGGSDVFPGLR